MHLIKNPYEIHVDSLQPRCYYWAALEDVMNTITITVSDDRLLKLKEVAGRFNITPEDLVRVSIDELLARPDDAFAKAANYVLDKNSELYRRLA